MVLIKKGGSMDQFKILLCCGSGMSSGFLASAARKYIKKSKMDASIEAVSQTEVGEFMSSVDVLLVGPHLAKDLEAFKKIAEPHGVKVAVIPEDIYATLDGPRLVDLAKSL